MPKQFHQLSTVEIATLSPSEIAYYSEEVGEERVLEEMDICKEELSKGELYADN